MEWLWIFTVVTALTQSVDCHMPPVENVSVECRNFQTVLHWNHGQPGLDPRFTVSLTRRLNYSSETVCSHSPVYSCDVSMATWGVIREDYKVSVTALGGRSLSQPVSVWFSYDKFSLTGKQCSVDLPPVNISVQSHRMLVDFRHPFEVYKQAVSQSEWEDCEKFEYAVTFKDQKTFEFSCDVPVCRAEIPGEMAAGTHCVRIAGVMGNVEVSSTGETCTEILPPDTSYHVVLLYVLIPGVVFSVTVCVLLMIIRSWTTRSSPLPKSIASRLQPLISGSPLHPERTTLCAVDITGSVPLIQTPEDTPPGHTPTSLTPTSLTPPPEPELRLPLGLRTPPNEASVPDVAPTLYDWSDNNPTTGGEGLVETEGSGYEKRLRHVPVFEEMGGEVVEGYRPSELGCPAE